MCPCNNCSTLHDQKICPKCGIGGLSLPEEDEAKMTPAPVGYNRACNARKSVTGAKRQVFHGRAEY